jgi:hypothetical protein
LPYHAEFGEVDIAGAVDMTTLIEPGKDPARVDMSSTGESSHRTDVTTVRPKPSD